MTRLAPEGVLVALAREQGLSLFVLPKGGVRRQETLEQAARREILEETGLFNLRLVRYLGMYPRLDFAKRRWLNIHYFLFITDQIEGKPTDTRRPYRLYWYPIDALPPMLWPEQRRLIENHRQEILKAFKLSDSPLSTLL